MALKSETPGNRRKNLMNGKETGVPFTSERQPSPEAKSAGWMRKLKGQQLARAVLELAFKGATDSKIKQQATEYFGIPEDQLTVEMMLHFRQAEKAIQKADTQAYNAIMARADGLPKQQTELTGKDGEPLNQPLTDSQVDKIISALRETKTT
jgi:hypothetical protein